MESYKKISIEIDSIIWAGAVMIKGEAQLKQQRGRVRRSRDSVRVRDGGDTGKVKEEQGLSKWQGRKKNKIKHENLRTTEAERIEKEKF